MTQPIGPYGVRIDNLLSISRSFVGGGSVPRSESPDGAGSYRTAPQGPLFRAQSRKSVGPYGVRIDNLLSISRSFVGGGSVPRSESPDGAGSYRTAPQGPLFRAQSRKSVGPYGVRIDNLLSISRSFVGGGSVPRSESPDGAGSYRTAPQGPLFRAQSRKSVGPYGVRIDNLLSISRSFVGGGSVPRSESPDGAGSYRTAPRGPLFRAQSWKSVGPYGVRIDNLLSISRSFDRGRKDRLVSAPPPSEPCRRISRTRLSSQWFALPRRGLTGQFMGRF